MLPSSRCWNTRAIEPAGILQFSRWDALLVGLAAIHGVILAEAPVWPVIAIGVWWNSNTISHNFIHRPFFRSPFSNLLFSCYLTVLLGIPQALWRDRHLAHHAGVEWRLRISPRLVLETLLVLGLWATLAALNPGFFLTTYLAGYLIGLGLCILQGYYEHANDATSHYGWFYNLLFFNDGYHVEHHVRPGIHWTKLARRAEPGARASRWPAVLRWMDGLTLVGLEKLVLRSRRLQSWVLRSHREAFRALISRMPAIDRVGIVGGGLFPRTALILQELLPGARITIIDADPRNLEVCRSFVGGPVEMVNERYVPGGPPEYDLVVIPLAFDGDRTEIYRHPPARAVLVHDWIWRRREPGRIVSLVLLKRLNLVMP